jgi:hypothetical protein
MRFKNSEMRFNLIFYTLKGIFDSRLWSRDGSWMSIRRIDPDRVTATSGIRGIVAVNYPFPSPGVSFACQSIQLPLAG